MTAGPSAISPEPSDAEAAAILAALSAVTGGGAPVADRSDVPRWRWSGRWWSKPAIVRRERPW